MVPALRSWGREWYREREETFLMVDISPLVIVGMVSSSSIVKSIVRS